ncbi:DUF4442 domain-containing protein [Burkholderia plantarii]|uniref:DUF4442 domain-containing protein n=1 Tax=Burkholderia plantarii TaxID=41899 RepID=UPI0027296D8F|nr:DUF4442 domain-containing protein [Burkholderia plantarii]WLE58833.1 DUF4442 domain-containing protein [Burkholderia plantarii]
MPEAVPRDRIDAAERDVALLEDTADRTAGAVAYHGGGPLAIVPNLSPPGPADAFTKPPTRARAMNRLFFNAFILAKVPIAWIAGVKLQHLDDRSCRMAVRYGWLNRNPFNSMFWAVEGMAAEFSTGALCIARLRKTERRISLLLVGLEANFSKKAVGRIAFRCDEGEAVDAVLRDVVADSVPRTLRMRSVGTDEQGDQVGEFFFTWSFKAKG